MKNPPLNVQYLISEQTDNRTHPKARLMDKANEIHVT